MPPSTDKVGPDSGGGGGRGGGGGGARRVFLRATFVGTVIFVDLSRGV